MGESEGERERARGREVRGKRPRGSTRRAREVPLHSESGSAELQGQTLASFCTAASGGAQAFTTAAEVHGSGWQLEICAALATPPHQIRGVLALGPPRCGKCHVGHQVYEALPPGTVVKAQEADKADIYTFGTKRGASAVLLQIDEFEAKAPLAKMKNLLEPHNTGFEVRTGSSKAGQTHTSLPPDLRVLITSNRKKEELERAYRTGGATDEDLDAFWERVQVVDLFRRDVQKRPRQDRRDLSPARVAATLAAYAAAATLPFPRQPTPSSSSICGPRERSPPAPDFSPQPAPPKRLCLSAPSKLTHGD